MGSETLSRRSATRPAEAGFHPSTKALTENLRKSMHAQKDAVEVVHGRVVILQLLVGLRTEGI